MRLLDDNGLLDAPVTITRNLGCNGCLEQNRFGGACQRDIICSGCCDANTCIPASRISNAHCPTPRLGSACTRCVGSTTCNPDANANYRCTSTPSCFDGVQNGVETGLDCGGSCGPCPSCNDGVQNQDEAGIDCGGSCPGVCPTCTDGIQNQDELDIDCGGSCPLCPTCSDNVQNGGERGIDCGGPCAACPCENGIRDVNEVGVDCGGECPASCLPNTCIDGVQNVDELGVDCGGICPSCMVRISSGQFFMGCVEGDTLCQSDELPRHQVFLDEFKIDQTEVTVAAYSTCQNQGTCSDPVSYNEVVGCNWRNPNMSDHPINCVTHEQASSYCRWASKQLPSESQWERSVRGDPDDIYSWGNSRPSGDLANYRSAETSRVFAAPIAGNGLYGMAGNLWEWVFDCYDEDIYGTRIPGFVNPINRCLFGERVIRGGGHTSTEIRLRASARSSFLATARSTDIGFRCVSTSSTTR